VPVSRYSFVTGIEADIQGVAGAGGNRGRVLAGAGQENGGAVNVVSYQQGSSNLSYLGTVRGRVGFLATPSLLLYGTAGLAYGGMSASIQNTQRMYWQFDNSSGAVFGQGSYSKTMVGWTAGGGVEWMFMPNWSAKAEYLYYDLGRASGSVVNNYFEPGNNGVESVTNYAGRVSGNIVRAGVNYHMNFASAPVIAKF
jgi:outer membrane immunogenic protein